MPGLVNSIREWSQLLIIVKIQMKHLHVYELEETQDIFVVGSLLSFYHINITQKLTLGIKKKPPLQSVHLFFFLAVLLHYTSLNGNSQVPSKTANQLPKKRSDTVVNETRFVPVLTDKCV